MYNSEWQFYKVDSLKVSAKTYKRLVGYGHLSEKLRVWYYYCDFKCTKKWQSPIDTKGK